MAAEPLVIMRSVLPRARGQAITMGDPPNFDDLVMQLIALIN